MKTIADSLIAAALVLAGGMAAPAAAQTDAAQRRQTFHSSLDLVTIQASVRDHRGRPMRGLSPKDFEIRDNGVVRPILSLRADARSPISVAVLIDMSGSMRVGPKLAMARRAFDSLVSQLRADQDEVALFTFDSALHERQDFTRDVRRVNVTWTEFTPFGTTSLYDATADAARRVAARSATHKAVILLTDGVDTSSTLTPPEVSALASSIDVPVYVVATVPSIDEELVVQASNHPQRSSADLRDLAEWTGGQLVFASTMADTTLAAAALISELRQQYILAIEAATGREWRRLDVRVRNRKARVKARSGYFAG